MSEFVGAGQQAPATVRLPDGRRLGYASYGDPAGSPVLYFHGWPGSHLDFVPNEQAARDHGARVIAVDRPGVGASDPSPGRRLADWAGDVAALADAIDLGEFAVLGYSFGGPYAVSVAHGLGPRVRALGLVSAMGPLDRPHATDGMARPGRLLLALSRRAAWLARPVVAGMTRSIARKPERFIAQSRGVMAKSDVAMLDARPDLAAAIANSVAVMCRGGTATALADARAVVQPWGLRLQDIRVPTFVWQGSADVNVPSHIAEYYASTIPGATLTMLAGEGHLLFYAHAASILETLTA